MRYVEFMVGKRPGQTNVVPTVTAIMSSSNLSNSTQSLPYNPSMTIFIVIITSLLDIGCVLGNTLVILAVFQVHKLKTAYNYLIVSLAVSDLLVGLFVMPLSIAYEILGYWPFQFAGCAIWVTLDVTLCTASILNLMMITVDRYMVITRPFRYSAHRKARLMFLYMAIAWTVSLLIGATPIMVKEHKWWPDYTSDRSCKVNQDVGYQIYATVGAFYIPLAVMIAMYGKIFYIVWKIRKAEAKNNPHTHQSITNNNSNCSPTLKQKYKDGFGRHQKSEKGDMTKDHHQDVIVIVSEADANKHDISTIDENQECSSDYDQPSDHEQDEMLHNRANPRKHRLSIVSDLSSHQDRKNSLRKFSIATMNSIKSFIHRHKATARNSHAVRTLGAIMGSFTLCWLPFFLLAIIAPICGETCTPILSRVPWLYGALTWLGYANSCLNPIIYAAFNREFRKPFKEILCCRCKSLNESVRHSDYLHQCGE